MHMGTRSCHPTTCQAISKVPLAPTEAAPFSKNVPGVCHGIAIDFDNVLYIPVHKNAFVRGRARDCICKFRGKLCVRLSRRLGKTNV